LVEPNALERQRQITEEGWTPEHDAQHKHGELAWAACYYAMPYPIGSYITPLDMFMQTGWHWKWAKRDDKDRKHQIIVAGALLLAEWDRLLAASVSK
jgi:hypothetical protein